MGVADFGGSSSGSSGSGSGSYSSTSTSYQAGASGTPGCTRCGRNVQVDPIQKSKELYHATF